jgi:hypothetical protein
MTTTYEEMGIRWLAHLIMVGGPLFIALEILALVALLKYLF